MKWVYSHMPKTGGTSIRKMLKYEPDFVHVGHHSAREAMKRQPGRKVLGSLRPPMDWYRSWYAHCADALAKGYNEKVHVALTAYGNGKTDFESVLKGLLYPEELSGRGLPYPGDHLFAPMGNKVWCGGGLYATSIVHFYIGTCGKWLTDAIIDTRHISRGLASIGVMTGEIHKNKSENVPEWPDWAWPRWEDERFWVEAQEFIV